MARDFGTSWWGAAWVDALEHAGPGYESRLPRGRAHARRGAVHQLEVHPGYIHSRVVERTGEIHDVTIAVRQLATSEWDQVAESIASRAAHLAALLDGELDPGVVADAESVDVQLLPRASDLRPDCSCPDWAEPCQHAAATCYVVAAELDRDPFVLFLLRGLGRDELITRVRAARSGVTDTPAVEPESARGVPATEVWLGRGIDQELGPPPAEALVGAGALLHPGAVAPWDVDLPAAQHLDPARVDDLAIDAVWRAWAMLVDGAPSGLAAGMRADLARRAAISDSPRTAALLAELAGVSPHRLRAWAQAWVLGGDVGVSVVADDAWSTDAERLQSARERLVDAGFARRSISLNYDSLRLAGDVWLVLGSDLRWYRLRGSGKHQDLELTQPPTSDVVDLVDPPST